LFIYKLYTGEHLLDKNSTCIYCILISHYYVGNWISMYLYWTSIETSHKLIVSNCFILKYSNFHIISIIFLRLASCQNVFFFRYFCQQYITDLEEMRNESQHSVYPPLTLITATHLVHWMNGSGRLINVTGIRVEIFKKYALRSSAAGSLVWTWLSRLWISFPQMFYCGSCRISTGVVMLESVVQKLTLHEGLRNLSM
jgi:hypothetical protein